MVLKYCLYKSFSSFKYAILVVKSRFTPRSTNCYAYEDSGSLHYRGGEIAAAYFLM